MKNMLTTQYYRVEKKPEHEVKHDPTSQCGRILRHLKEHGKITNIELVQNFHILRASERVRELRSEGHLIRSIRESNTVWVYVYEGEE